MNLGKRIAIAGRKKGLCESWQAKLAELSKQEDLLRLYLEGIDFCLSEDFPSPRFLKEQADEPLLESFGIYIDREGIRAENHAKVVCLGGTTGSVRGKDFEVSEIFIKHRSSIEIKAQGNSFIMVDMFDDSVLSVQASGNAKVCINRYGGALQYTERGDAKIKIIEKSKKTY